MSRTVTIETLCRRFHNEDVHTEHVARLALAIFDGVQERLRLSASDRSLLEAAARLHDIGYATAPGDHVRHGAEIVRRQSLPGFTAAEVRAVVAIMLLHAARWEDYRRHRAFRGLADPARILKLGAILRVADALDHSHLQNASIISVTVFPAKLVLKVASPGTLINVERARQKADLWPHATRVPLLIEPAKLPRQAVPFGDVLPPTVSAIEAVRRLLFFYYRSVTRHGRLALTEDDPIHLHDLRVGIRRCRSVLRLLRREMAPTSAEALNGLLQTLSARFGPLRDADVWMERLHSDGARQQAARDPDWGGYVARHRKEAAQNLRRLRAILNGSTYREAVLRMSILLRVEIPELQRLGGRVRPAQRAVAGRLRRIVRRIGDHEVFRQNRDAEAQHELRILCRRGRYWTEFCAPLFGPGTVELARRLKAVADALGDLHDLDVAIENLDGDETAPRVLRSLLRSERLTVLRTAAMEWSRLQRKKLLTRARKEMD